MAVQGRPHSSRTAASSRPAARSGLRASSRCATTGEHLAPVELYNLPGARVDNPGCSAIATGPTSVLDVLACIAYLLIMAGIVLLPHSLCKPHDPAAIMVESQLPNRFGDNYSEQMKEKESSDEEVQALLRRWHRALALTQGPL